MQGISKRFPGVNALNNVSLDLYKGEVLALVGENGAGKSTLIKILGGAFLPDTGKIFIEGNDPKINSPILARNTGVSIIYQEFNLIPDLTVRENIFLGRERIKAGFIDASAEYDESIDLFKKLGMDIDPDSLCRDLNTARQQTVEIAKALLVKSKIIVMDEPSAALTTQEVDTLFTIIKDLKSKGIGIIYISHRIDEVFQIADRVMVLRDGEQIGTQKVKKIKRKKLIEMMVGRSLESEFPKKKAKHGPEWLKVENLIRGKSVRDVSFSVHSGEVLGFSGLVGAGRTETMRIIFGADRPESGRIFIKDKETEISTPRHAIKNRICLLTEDRKAQGLVFIHSVLENFSLPNLTRFSRRGFLSHKEERREFDGYVTSLKIRISDHNQLVMNLSGGNQQKVVLAKWLAKNADIIIFDEPTKGIDVGAKYEIYLLINELASRGKAIIMISSELPEILGMSDRIIVMHEGRIVGNISDVKNTSQENILSMIYSSSRDKNRINNYVQKNNK